ncbi:MAG TPA: hypothetical protein VI749_08910 [Candidatus Omnitrophota bacterium]|nr:hypothetical protein [Candidatus Omnitrophota bacterium]
MLFNKSQQEFLLKDETKKFLDILFKIDKEKPDSKDLREAENMVCNNPSLCQVGIGYTGSLLEQFIDKLNPSNAQQLILKAEVMSIRENLGYNTSDQSERLIIDQIMLCWIGMNHAEGRMHNLLTGGEYSIRTGEYWQENLTRYQNRYLKAIETLARIRRLNKGMVLQVNIAADGGKQININKS